MTSKENKVKIAKSIAQYANKTGNFLERRDPELSAKVLDMLADGESFTAIAKKTNLGWETIGRLRARHKVALEERRAMLAEDALDIAEGLRLLQKKKMEMLATDDEQLARTNIRDLTLPWGIANDKYLAAMGENKVTIEHKTAAPSLEDAMKAIEEARAKLRSGSVEILTKDVSNEATKQE
jgi:hypothetical protein